MTTREELVSNFEEACKALPLSEQKTVAHEMAVLIVERAGGQDKAEQYAMKESNRVAALCGAMARKV